MTAKTILVIDTDIETIKKIMMTLESEGFLVLKASNKDSGLFTAKKVKPSIIFINVGISGASGLEICKTIHADNALNHIPIVIITPQDVVIDSQDAALYGIVDFLKKSFTTEELITKTNTMLARYSITLQHGDEKAPEQTIDLDIESERVDEQEAEEEPIGIKNKEYHFEEHVTAQPVEEQNEVYPFAEYLESATKESLDEKEDESDIQHTDKESASLNALSAEGWEEQGEKRTAEDVNEQTDWNFFSDDATPPQVQDQPLPKKRAGKHKINVFLLLVLLLIVIIGFGGFLFYRNFIQGTNLLTTKENSFSPQAQREAGSLQHPDEIQRAKDSEKNKSAVLTTPETKLEAKPFYVLQIGAFKVDANAQSFRKQYQEKGYDAHIEKIKTQDNEIFYKVFIGSFENRKKAVEAARAISAKEKIQTIIVRR